MRRILLIGAALVACDGRSRPGPLPDRLTAVVALESGGVASVSVDLPRPRSAPVVRMVPGAVALGPGWARGAGWEDPGEGGAGLWFSDLDPGVSHRVTLSTSVQGRLLAIDGPGAWFSGSGGRPLWVGAGPAPDQVAPGGSLTRHGPGQGFSLRLYRGRLELQLPRTEGWSPVATGVEAVLGSWWLTTPDLEQWERDLTDRWFKQVAALRAEAGSAVVDGSLSEWRGQRAVAVDASTQVLDGLEHWSGPRDGAFGVALRHEDRTLYMAIRLRDDMLIEGRDRVDVQLDGRTIEIPILLDAGEVAGPYWRAAFGDAHPMGTAFEVQVDNLQTHGPVLPVIVAWHDVDEGGTATVLGTAAWPELLDAGVHSRGDPSRRPE